MPTTKETKPNVISDQYRRFAVDTFSMRVNDNMAQVTFALESADKDDNAVVVREATAVMTLKSLKVMHLLISGIITSIERDLGIIELGPGKEQQIKSMTSAIKRE